MKAGKDPEAPPNTKHYCSWQKTTHWGSHPYKKFYF